MKNLLFKRFLIIGFIIVGLASCSTNNIEDNTSNSNETIKNLKRPEKSDENAKKLLGKFDSKVVLVMRSVRELKKSIKKGNKVTSTIEKNITEMIDEAKGAQEALEPFLDKLSEDDFGLFERDKGSLRSKETKFEELKQNK